VRQTDETDRSTPSHVHLSAPQKFDKDTDGLTRPCFRQGLHSIAVTKRIGIVKQRKHVRQSVFASQPCGPEHVISAFVWRVFLCFL